MKVIKKQLVLELDESDIQDLSDLLEILRIKTDASHISKEFTTDQYRLIQGRLSRWFNILQ